MTREQRNALLKILLLGVILLLLCACGPPAPTEGYVTRHEYDDPDDVWHPGYTIDGGQSCSGGYGNPPSPRVCTDNPDIHIPGHWEHQDERFILHIRKEETTKNDKGKSTTVVRTGNCSVPDYIYEKVANGQYFDCKTLEVIPK